MIDIMLDLETLGTRPGSVVLSIGAVAFTPEGVFDKGFHTIIRKDDCVANGLTVDPDTEAWWLDQSDEAQDTLRRASVEASWARAAAPNLVEALADFSNWLLHYKHVTRVRLWACGADFDPPLLAAAYASPGPVAALGGQPPWEYRDVRCYRTLKALYPRMSAGPRQGTHHNALDDARHQATHAVAIMQERIRTRQDPPAW